MLATPRCCAAVLYAIVLAGVPAAATVAADASTRALIGTIESRREEPRRRIEAIDMLARHDAAAAVPVLIDALNDLDPAVRAAAARAFWMLADDASGPGRAAAARGRTALHRALDDPSVEVAVYAAQALEQLGETRQALAPLRRAALGAPGPYAYARHLAARGLVGIERPLRLLPAHVDWLREAHERYAEGGLRRADVEAAGAALKRLAQQRDPELGPALLGELSLAHPASSELLHAAARVEPVPAGLTDAAIAMLESMHDRVRASAIEVLSTRTAASEVARWHPAVARVLTRDPRPDDYVLHAALGALAAAARVDPGALPALARWATGTEPAESRASAVEALAAASDALDERLPEAVRAAAKPIALGAFAAILAREGDGAPFRAAARALQMSERDEAAAARRYADALIANPHPSARVLLLGRLESLWAAARAEVPRIAPLTRDPDAGVRAAAEAALARIAPAHRAEAARRAQAAGLAPDARAAPVATAAGARPVDWLVWGEAIKSGDAARLRRLVDRGNVNRVMTMQGRPTSVGPPINGVLSYCGIPQVPEAHLVTAIGVLLELGADPAVDHPAAGGGSALDYAVLACPRAVQAALGID